MALAACAERADSAVFRRAHAEGNAGRRATILTRRALTRCSALQYTVTAETDRMGCRLSGANVPFAEGKNGNIVSDAVAFGSVQIPSGQPIIMMADHQTTGGYAKPCCVISADLPLAAQLRAGDRVRFAPIEVNEAPGHIQAAHGGA